jgi:hypothetical protein
MCIILVIQEGGLCIIILLECGYVILPAIAIGSVVVHVCAPRTRSVLAPHTRLTQFTWERTMLTATDIHVYNHMLVTAALPVTNYRRISPRLM